MDLYREIFYYREFIFYFEKKKCIDIFLEEKVFNFFYNNEFINIELFDFKDVVIFFFNVCLE